MTTTGSRALLLIGAAAVAVAVGTWDAAARQGEMPQGWRFTLPAGEPVRGEGVFRRLGCGSCHNVAGQEVTPAERQSKGIGPDLTPGLAGLPSEYLAEKLITPDRFLPHGLFKATYSRSDGSSRMENFNDDMSVNDLIDLVAFLKSL
jgi:hypothetical protein